MANLNDAFENGTQVPDSAPEPESLTFRERALRDLFVVEYLIDYDAIAACQRCGFNYQFAVDYSLKFMREPYVLQKINKVKFQETDEESSLEFDTKRIRASLMAEAHYRGPGSSHAARVAALSKLAALCGMEAPKKFEQTINHRGGVMAVPGIASLDDWEQAASASQDALVKDARL